MVNLLCKLLGHKTEVISHVFVMSVIYDEERCIRCKDTLRFESQPRKLRRLAKELGVEHVLR